MLKNILCCAIIVATKVSAVHAGNVDLYIECDPYNIGVAFVGNKGTEKSGPCDVSLNVMGKKNVFHFAEIPAGKSCQVVARANPMIPRIGLSYGMRAEVKTCGDSYSSNNSSQILYFVAYEPPHQY